MQILIPRRPIFRTSVFIGLFLSFSSPAWAAETETGGLILPTDTGALIEFRMEQLAGITGKTLPDTLTAIFLAAAKQENWEAETGRYRQKIASFRATCRATIRKANRDSIMKQSTLCYRGDLLLHASHLRRQREYVRSLPPGIEEETASGATLAIGNLIDAELAIVDALDALLFQTVGDLISTKQKLDQHYRTPYRLALNQVRADRQLTIIALMLKRIQNILLEGGNTPLIEKSMVNALSCMVDAGEKYRTILQSDDTSIAEKAMSEASILLPECKIMVASVARLKNRQAQASIEITP